MPQISYLVRSQVTARLPNPTTGFNYWLAQACAGQVPAPLPYLLDWTPSSSNFWTSYCTPEDLDTSSTVADGTICLVYGCGIANMEGTVQKFAVFSGTVDVAVELDIAWTQSFIPHDTDGIADATDDAMIQSFNSSAYFDSFYDGVIYNGTIRGDRGPLRASGSGWRQRIPYRIHFEAGVRALKALTVKLPVKYLTVSLLEPVDPSTHGLRTAVDPAACPL